MQKLAVIDLGTNTFHLLIVAVVDGRFREIHRQREFVKLAEDGIDWIGEGPFQRGLTTLATFAQILKDQNVEQVQAFGTAALRTAQNGTTFIQQVREKTGLDIQIISGAEEARLIHQGVSQAIALGSQPALIMDIGGGSVEFILADQNGVQWAQSFPIGVAVLYRERQHSDPISADNIREIEEYLDTTLVPLKAILASYAQPLLIGASGTFDVIELFLASPTPQSISSEVSVEQFRPFAQMLLQSTLAERRQIPKLPAERAEMIVVAIVLIDYIVRLAGIETIQISAYAMKEGILKEML